MSLNGLSFPKILNSNFEFFIFQLYSIYDASYTAVLKIRVEVRQSFIQSRNIIIEYHWLPHWKCTARLSYQLDFARSYTEVGQKMTCDGPLF